MKRLGKAQTKSGLFRGLTEKVLANSSSDHFGVSALARRRSFRVTAKRRTKSPPIAHGAKNMASRLPVNSLTRNVPHTDAMGRQTPRTHHGGEQRVKRATGRYTTRQGRPGCWVPTRQ